MTCLHRTLAIIDQISSFRENSLSSSGQIPHNSSPLQPLQSLQWGGLLNNRIVVIWPLSLLVHKFGRLMQVSNVTLISHTSKCRAQKYSNNIWFLGWEVGEVSTKNLLPGKFHFKGLWTERANRLQSDHSLWWLQSELCHVSCSEEEGNL